MIETLPEPDLSLQPDVRVFSPTRKLLYIALGCLIFFSAMTVSGIYLPLANPDGSFRDPVAWAIIDGCFWGTMTIGAVFLLLAYRRMRVFTSTGLVQVIGVFRIRTIVLSEVTRAVWGRWPAGGTISLRGPAGRVAIEFAMYNDGKVLAQFFREGLPSAVQERIDRFEAATNPTKNVSPRQRDRNRRIIIFIYLVMGVTTLAACVWIPFEPERARWGHGIISGILTLFCLWNLIFRWRTAESVEQTVEKQLD